MRRIPWLLGVVALVALGCGAGVARDGDDYRDPYMDEPLPPVCRDTSTGPCDTEDPTGDPTDGDQCGASSECPDGQRCRAEFSGDRTAFECTAVCVPTADEDAWCIDDVACCDPAARCSPRGYCLVP